jgi:hypothetical protein
MKITCDIINDLIPLYIDNICTEDSRKLIEEHMKCCDKCYQKMEDMKNPIEYPQMLDAWESKEPFKKIKKKVRICLIMAVIITGCIVSSFMFAVQEVGWLHNYIHPRSETVIDNEIDQVEWSQIKISQSDFLNFSSIFYNKEMINDANSSGYVVVRILNENRNIILDETIVNVGEAISLKMLEDNLDYIVEVKCKEGRYFLNFI